MIKVIAALIAVFSGLAFISFTIGVRPLSNAIPPPSPPHRYKEPHRSIEHLRIAAFYFIPGNKAFDATPDWKPALNKHLAALKFFHEHQFRGRSSLSATIHDSPIIGEEDNRAYDTDETRHGNPEALRHIMAELERRGFVSASDDTIVLILYEGVGAVGSDGAFLVSRLYMTDQEYTTSSKSVVAHEFYHTLLLPDRYDLTTGLPLSEDLMGSGRYRPIEQNHLDTSTLAAMGL